MTKAAALTEQGLDPKFPADSIAQRHRRHVLTPWQAQGELNPPIIVRGEGSFISDAAGRKYLDLSSGLVCVNLGHGHPRVVQAIAEQASKLCFASPALFNDKRAALAEKLSGISPWDEGARVFFNTSGTEAIDDAVKIARFLTGRFKVLASYRSFHGATGASAMLTGENRRWPAEPGVPGVVHFFAPYPYRSPFFTADESEETERAIEHLKQVLLFEDARRVAAIVIEPVVGSNGVIVYSKGYLRKLRELTREHGILLVFDEVMTGFGRTGDAFAAQRFGVTPDLIAFAKGVTSAYVPLGGVLMPERLARHFDREVLWTGHTFSGHPLAMAAGCAAVEAYLEEGLFQRAREIEGWLAGGLDELKQKHELVGDVRGLGAFFAVELVKDRATMEPLSPVNAPASSAIKAFFAALWREGVYALGRQNIAIVAPSLRVSRDEIELGIQALDSALLAAKSVV